MDSSILLRIKVIEEVLVSLLRTFEGLLAFNQDQNIIL